MVRGCTDEGVWNKASGGAGLLATLCTYLGSVVPQLLLTILVPCRSAGRVEGGRDTWTTPYHHIDQRQRTQTRSGCFMQLGCRPVLDFSRACSCCGSAAQCQGCRRAGNSRHMSPPQGIGVLTRCSMTSKMDGMSPGLAIAPCPSFAVCASCMSKIESLAPGAIPAAGSGGKCSRMCGSTHALKDTGSSKAAQCLCHTACNQAHL